MNYADVELRLAAVALGERIHHAYESSLCIARRKRGRGQGARKRRAREARTKMRSGVRHVDYAEFAREPHEALRQHWLRAWPEVQQYYKDVHKPLLVLRPSDIRRAFNKPFNFVRGRRI